MTTKLNLNLTSAGDIRRALEFVGVNWDPTPVSGTQPVADGGILYTWGVGGESINDFAVLYIGKDVRNGERINNEITWSDEAQNNYHGHALAVRRTGMRVIAARPELLPQPALDLKSAAALSYVAEKQLAGSTDHASCTRALKALSTQGIRAFENFAIRLSIHLGDVGAPINAASKSAWALSSSTLSDLNELAYYAAHAIRNSKV